MPCAVPLPTPEHHASLFLVLRLLALLAHDGCQNGIALAGLAEFDLESLSVLWLLVRPLNIRVVKPVRHHPSPRQ